MHASFRNISMAIALLIGLLVLALRLFFDINAYTPRFEAAASDALGMEVRIGGPVGIRFFPGVLVTLDNAQLRNRGVDVATAKRVRLEIAMLPLLRNQVRIEKVALEHPRIHVERDREGRFNYEKPGTAGETLAALKLAQLSLSDGTLLYLDQRTGRTLEAGSCSLNASRLELAQRVRPGTMKALSLAAELACGEIRTKGYAASDLNISISGKHGVFDLKPLTLHMFGGQGTGSIRADFTGVAPHYDIRYSLPQFRIETFLENLSGQQTVKGSMDFSANLTMRGETVNALRRTLEGQISLRGKHLILDGRDLDQAFARYDSSQSFNLVDVGALFLVGPVGLAVTKGYDFASMLQRSGGQSAIPTFVSDWTVDHGIARSKDVAMATTHNRVALQGGLDIVNERFDDMTVALIDDQGCVRARQTVQGAFSKPVVERPSVLKSLAGPVVTLFKQVGRLVPGGKCEVFYAGSVAPPK